MATELLLLSMSQKRLPPRMPSILLVPFRSKLLSPISNKKIFVLKDGYGASAIIDLYAGQVTSWKTDRGEELLFSSSKMVSPKSHRGGINFCFPQFLSMESSQSMQHVAPKRRNNMSFSDNNFVSSES